mmetsp:Transcript_128998/g.222895  ORF Transcript_128998/g.222895 Transcript_128998/m.222895 type:complete len:202 (+) Transcript_128998:1092-1697(+)
MEAIIVLAISAIRGLGSSITVSIPSFSRQASTDMTILAACETSKFRAVRKRRQVLLLPLICWAKRELGRSRWYSAIGSSSSLNALILAVSSGVGGGLDPTALRWSAPKPLFCVLSEKGDIHPDEEDNKGDVGSASHSEGRSRPVALLTACRMASTHRFCSCWLLADRSMLLIGVMIEKHRHSSVFPLARLEPNVLEPKAGV